MTITPTAPTVTPCPVDWCRSARSHEWEPEEVGLDMSRIHARETLNIPSGYGRDIRVAAEVYENEERVASSVELYDAEALHSREQVEKVIVAMREAATLAFGEAASPKAASPQA